MFGGVADPDVLFLANLTTMCENFHCLPKQGGLYDQDAILVQGMQLVIDARVEKERKDVEQQTARAKKK